MKKYTISRRQKSTAMNIRGIINWNISKQWLNRRDLEIRMHGERRRLKIANGPNL